MSERRVGEHGVPLLTADFLARLASLRAGCRSWRWLSAWALIWFGTP